MDNPKFYTTQENIGVIEFDDPDSKVNLLSEPVLRQLDYILDSIKSMQDLKGVLINSRKEGVFIAGADIKEIQGIQTKEDAIKKSKQGQDIFNKLEALKIPTVALINGVCLGGGLELALACKYRIASYGEKVRIGLPEVQLGIIPGFGGTERLPRLIGLQKGIEMVTSGKPVSSRDALKIGLVDRLCHENRLSEEGIELLQGLDSNKEKSATIRGSTSASLRRDGQSAKIRVQKGFLRFFLENTLPGRIILFNQSKKIILKNTKGFYPAPLKALEVIKKGGLKLEREAFAELITGEIAKNLIALFYLNERYKKFDWIKDPDIKSREIRRCGVLGAGVMGSGIAQVLSSRDLSVRIKDIDYPAIGKALKACNDIYRNALKKHIFRQNEIDYKFGLISGTVDYSGFKKIDIIIEAIIEDMALKKKVIGEVCRIVPEDAIIASNTSTLPITELSGAALNPSRVIGMHFFNPAHRMPLIEVIPARATSREVIATVVELSRKLGKTPVVVKDSLGFLVNRVLLPYLNEAGTLLDEGYKIGMIDSIMRTFGMPMGPLEVIDEIGLDVGYKVASILEKAYPDRMKASHLLKEALESKWLGKKTKKGFYIHRGKKKMPNQGIYRLVKKNPACKKEDILKRMVLVMLNEACRCLEEGVVNEPGDIDISLIMGTGFPPFKGGLLRYADSTRLKNILFDLERFFKSYGNRFKPAELIINMVKGDKRFYG